jgi:hypothetical protein
VAGGTISYFGALRLHGGRYFPRYIFTFLRGDWIIEFITQHTPVVPGDSIHWDHSHDLITELIEEGALQGLGKVVSDHFFGRIVLYCNLLAGNAVGNKEVPNVYVTCSLAA